MRSITNILVSLVFLVSFIGVQINTHYSKGELFSVAVFLEAQSCCDDTELCHEEKHNSPCCEKQKTNHKSCEDFSSFYKLNDVFVSEQLSIPKVKSLELITNLSSFLIFDTLPSCKNHLIIFYSPPILSNSNPQADTGVFLC